MGEVVEGDDEYVTLPSLDSFMSSPLDLPEENAVIEEGFVVLPSLTDVENDSDETREAEEDVEEVITTTGVDDSSTASTDVTRTGVRADAATRRIALSDLVDRRARIALGGGAYSFLIGVDGETVYEMDAVAMRQQTDELLMFGAGTRLVEKLLEAMTVACDCSGCDDCVRLAEWRSGQRLIEWRDVTDYSVLNWVFYAIELTSSTPDYDEDRLFWFANQRWDADTGKIIEPRLVAYLKPPSLIDEAAQTLVARIAEASDECARRRANYVSRQRG
jgi:hypothetical protein